MFSIEDVGLAGCRPSSASLDEVLSDQLQAGRDAEFEARVIHDSYLFLVFKKALSRHITDTISESFPEALTVACTTAA